MVKVTREDGSKRMMGIGNKQGKIDEETR